MDVDDDDNDADAVDDTDDDAADPRERVGKRRHIVTCPDLHELNLGCNPLNHLPKELGMLTSLTKLWLDDCRLSGPLPSCLYRLCNLEELRLSKNSITEIRVRGGVNHVGNGVGVDVGVVKDDLMNNDDCGLEQWTKMKVLCLDSNQLTTLPFEVFQLSTLTSLMLRNNQLTTLQLPPPSNNNNNIKLLHLSSNKLQSLPSTLMECCTSLTCLYANKNHIDSIPQDLAKKLTNLTTLNLSSNQISSLPDDFMLRFGMPDPTDGLCHKDESCTVYLDQNPIVTELRQEPGVMPCGVPYSIKG